MTDKVPIPLLINFNALVSLTPVEAVAMKDDVIRALTKHPFFKDIPLAPLAEAGKGLEESIRLTSLGNRPQIPVRNMYHGRVIKELARISSHVHLQGLDEESQMHTTGLPLAERRTRTPKTARAAVTVLTGFEAINLDEPGGVMLNADSQDAAFGYQFQLNKVNPAVEENWVDDGPAPHRVCKKVVIRGLDSLTRISFRGRAIGDDGPGPWSKPVTISV